jgi:predicted dehydrogenase
MSASALARPVARSPLRLGFLGLGWIGRTRLDAIASFPAVEVAAIADSHPERLAAARRQHAAAVAAASLEDLRDCDLDGVVIATPSGLHAEQAIACLARGWAVFCQKPLATNAVDAGRVLEAARRANRLLGVDFCYRHVQGMSELRARIADGQLGRIAAMDLVFHNAYGPDKGWCFDRQLSGGGCLLDLGIHLIDLALWLHGSEPLQLVSRHLFTHGLPAAVGGIEDLAIAEFQRTDGGLVRLACSWNAHLGRDALVQVQLIGSQGGAAWRNVNGSFYDFELEVYRGTSRERLGGFPDAWGERALKSWVAQLAADGSFDPQSLDIVRSAQLIDEVYAPHEAADDSRRSGRGLDLCAQALRGTRRARGGHRPGDARSAAQRFAMRACAADRQRTAGPQGIPARMDAGLAGGCAPGRELAARAGREGIRRSGASERLCACGPALAAARNGRRPFLRGELVASGARRAGTGRGVGAVPEAGGRRARRRRLCGGADRRFLATADGALWSAAEDARDSQRLFRRTLRVRAGAGAPADSARLRSALG